MKVIVRILVIFVLLINLYFNSVAIAEDTGCSCKESVIKPDYYFWGGIQKYTGLDFISKSLSETLISNYLKEQLGAQHSVKLKLFSTSDLLKGKIKGFETSSTNIKVDDFTIKSFKTSSLCECLTFKYDVFRLKAWQTSSAKLYAHAIIEKKEIERIILDQITRTTEINIGKASACKVDIEFVSPKIEIINNRVHFESKVKAQNAFLSLNVPVKAVFVPQVVNNNFELTIISFEPDILPSKKFIMANINESIKKLTSKSFSLNNKDLKYEIKSIFFEKNNLNVVGLLFLPYDENCKISLIKTSGGN